MKTIIRNGFVCLDDRIEKCDVLIDGGKIAAIGTMSETKGADRTIDGTDKFVLPGLIDIHTHLEDRIGDYDLADTYLSGTEIAVCNGITTLCNFITQGKTEYIGASIARAEGKAAGNCHCNIGWHVTPISFGPVDWREIEDAVDRGFRSFKFYTTYRHAGIYCAYDQLESVVRRLAPQSVQFLVHCEDDEILFRKMMLVETGTGFINPIAHALARPPEAEVTAIRRVMEIAVRYQAKLHIVHVSTSEGAAVVNEAKKHAPVTCETAPQYLYLTDDMLRRTDGHRWICSPPLRSESERLQLKECARNGNFDLFATDHCAFSRTDKDVPAPDIRSVPNGLAGIGSMPHLIFKLFEKDVPYSMQAMRRHLSEAPARLIGQYPAKGSLRAGSDADIVVLDAAVGQRALHSSLADVHETYPGMTTHLGCSHVFVGGREVVRDGVLTDPRQPAGRSIHQRK